MEPTAIPAFAPEERELLSFVAPADGDGVGDTMPSGDVPVTVLLRQIILAVKSLGFTNV